jgi:hypothetical protein
MRRFIMTTGGIAIAGLFAGCAPAYVQPRPVYGQPMATYGPLYGDRGEWRGDERRERHEAREHEEHEEHEHDRGPYRALPQDGD